MKRQNLLYLLLVVPLLLALIAACAPPAATVTSPEPQTREITGKTSDRNSDWDLLVKEARKEGRVVIYGSVIGDARDQFVKAFKNRYGIDLEFLQGRGAEIIEKLLSERRAGLYLADVSIGGLTTFFNVTEPANISLPLEPIIMLDEVKDPKKWRAGKIPFIGSKKQVIALAAAASLCVTVNTDLVKDSEITSYNDLLAPKWKGKIVINDPSSSGKGNSWFTYMMLIAYGKEKGMEYMKKMVLQEPIVIRDERLQMEWLAKGKYPMLVGAKTTEVERFLNVGAPIKSINVKEGAPLLSGSLNLNAFQNAPHPNALKIFVNWILTKEAGEIITKTSGFASERTDVSKEGLDPSVLPGPKDILELEDERYIVEKAEMQKVAAEIFKGLLK